MKFNKELNHSASHVMAMAVLKLFPDTKLGFGPPTKEGFYYDFKFSQPLLEADLKRIEKQMQKIVANPYLMRKMASTYKYDVKNQPYKAELIKEFKAEGKKITYYSIYDPKTKQDLFVDLCAGGHIDEIKKIKHFKVLSLAGAYWRGDSNNEQLTRIYATAWESAQELKDFLDLLEERKARDHRKIGKEMELFMFDHMAGQGFPIWLPDGIKIRNRVLDQILKFDLKYGFNEVVTPIVGEKKLYEVSGHWDHYKESMFHPIECDHERLVLRPMTCPHHILVYKSKLRSYRDLPYRLSEQSPLFRYEKTGALTGMERVRSMLLTEGHVFVMRSQIVDEFKHCYKLIQEALALFNIKIDYVSLSVRDPEDKEKYFNDNKIWEEAENDLRKVLKELNIDYEEKVGEAAFYGPKIDIQIRTALGHEITMSTLQLDFVLPRKFEISYVSANNELETPILVHRGLIGTYERFLSILLEQTKGILPFWLAPKQVCIIPINHEKHNDFAQQINQELVNHNFYSYVDDRNERINKKIREAQIAKAKIQIVIGDEEIETQQLSLRFYASEQIIKIDRKDLLTYLNDLTKESMETKKSEEVVEINPENSLDSKSIEKAEIEDKIANPSFSDDLNLIDANIQTFQQQNLEAPDLIDKNELKLQTNPILIKEEKKQIVESINPKNDQLANNDSSSDSSFQTEPLSIFNKNFVKTNQPVLDKPKNKKEKNKLKTNLVKLDESDLEILLSKRHKRFSNFDHPTKMFSFFRQETWSETNAKKTNHFSKKIKH